MLRAVGEGESAVVVLSGEPGIGKTALIAEVLARARDGGYEVFGGRAAEFEQDLPFAVFVDALADEVESLQLEEENSISSSDLALLASVFPALARGAAVQPPQPQADDRHRLLRALHRLLEVVARREPLVLALDDLHWADPASIDLVCRLLHRGMDNPSLLLLASRPAQSHGRLRTALEEADRHRRARRIELGPLSAEEASTLLGEELDAGLRQSLYRQSGGNPLYLEQLAAAARRGAPLPGAPTPRRGGCPWRSAPPSAGSSMRCPQPRGPC